MSFLQFDKFKNWNVGLDRLQQEQVLRRFIERSSEREHINNELETKSPIEVDTPERVTLRKEIINPRNGLALEQLIGHSDLFPISYLEAGLKVAKPVCRIEVRDRIGRFRGHGTGFLVSPTLLLTNNHVLKDKDEALFSVAQFNYELDINYNERQTKSFRFTPERLFITNEKLDFTLVALEEVAADGTNLSDFGFLPLLVQQGKVLKGEYVSIIQHPSGAPKQVAIRENKVVDIFEDYVHYSTDTVEGSSGSPVYNDQWMVIALHHAAIPDPNSPDKNNPLFICNEGIRISSIVQFILSQYSNLSEDKKILIDAIVKDWQLTDQAAEGMLVEELSNEWYEGLTGYNTMFLGNNHEVPHPKFRSDLEQDIAILKDGSKVLNYRHFSIVMSKSRRLAYYTVVNIDGKQLSGADRIKNWFFDPRIEKKYQCGPELYKNNPLDQGHLVRRLDPVWGEVAEQANKDTFHYTNCSPQHEDLNQKTWLDLENYILNNAQTHKLKATVFTGPVFRVDDMIYRGVQIPVEFWKVAVIVKEDGNLSATAYLQSQKNLITNLEFAYGEYKTYQVKVSDIEKLTGLDFGELRNHDPIAHLEAKIGHIIENPEDIQL
ncbi:DNA/RNA non-specific endonuclease [Bacillus anthracis]|uniref:DNA/RNA non-specific endonuclease n=1 Tax=Bacillus anthracis TaxID=1392 RepID=UPI003D19B029